MATDHATLYFTDTQTATHNHHMENLTLAHQAMWLQVICEIDRRNANQTDLDYRSGTIIMSLQDWAFFFTGRALGTHTDVDAVWDFVRALQAIELHDIDAPTLLTVTMTQRDPENDTEMGKGPLIGFTQPIVEAHEAHLFKQRDRKRKQREKAEGKTPQAQQ